MATTPSTNKYALVSDEPEAQRLNKQHELFKVLFDGNLLPRELKLENGDTILDSGTGTGIWALGVASSVPDTVEIHGIDITPHLFPVSPPSNAHFSVGNVLDLPPSESSKYTFVHQRLLSGAFHAEDWQKCVAQIYSALRPGGWIMLEELRGRVVPETLPYSHRLTDISKTLERMRGIDFAAVDSLPRWLEDAGFEEVKVDVRRWMLGPGEETRERRDIMIGAWRAIRLGVRKAGYDMGMTDEEWEQFMRDFDNELQEHEAFLPIHSITARKPAK